MSQPPLVPAPKLPPPTPEQIAREEHLQQLRYAYGQFFGSTNGKLILADLKERYGFAPDGTEHSSYVRGMTHADQSFTEGMKEPVRHILRQQTLPEKPETKPATATS